MKLTDVGLRVIGGRAYLVRLDKAGKVKQKISCESEFIKHVVDNFDGCWIKQGDKQYLTAVREMSKEQIAVYNLLQKKDRSMVRKRGTKAFISMQSAMASLYTGYSQETINALRKYNY